MFTTLINKEEVSKLHFAHHEVLDADAERKRRRWNLEKALTLGNGYHGKVHIVFENEMGEAYEVDTTVWAVTDTHISLKGGVVIPIHSIREVLLVG